MNDRRLTKLLLRIFIVSICATALAGIIALVMPSGEEWCEKVLATTATIAGASVCGLSCGGGLSRGRTILPLAGLALTLLAACLILVGIWPDINSEGYWKLTASVSFFAVACAHLSMLFMANLAAGYRWAYLVTSLLIFGLATLLASGIVCEFFDSEAYARMTGVVSILVAASTILVPVLHFLSRDQIAAAQAEVNPSLAVDEEIARLKQRLVELEDKRRTMP